MICNKKRATLETNLLRPACFEPLSSRLVSVENRIKTDIGANYLKFTQGHTKFQFFDLFEFFSFR